MSFKISLLSIWGTKELDSLKISVSSKFSVSKLQIFTFVDVGDGRHLFVVTGVVDSLTDLLFVYI
jgi:hypothetical protein